MVRVSEKVAAYAKLTDEELLGRASLLKSEFTCNVYGLSLKKYRVVQAIKVAGTAVSAAEAEAVAAANPRRQPKGS